MKDLKTFVEERKATTHQEFRELRQPVLQRMRGIEEVVRLNCRIIGRFEEQTSIRVNAHTLEKHLAKTFDLLQQLEECRLQIDGINEMERLEEIAQRAQRKLNV